jgi:DNA processing protein
MPHKPTDTQNNNSAQQNNSASKSAIPEHLSAVYEQLDWHGQDLDALLISTELSPPELIGQLMELELSAVISVQGGHYLRL